MEQQRHTFEELVELKRKFDSMYDVTKEGVTFIAPYDFDEYIAFIVLFAKLNRNPMALHDNSFPKEYLKDKTGIDLFFVTYNELRFSGTTITVKKHLHQYMKERNISFNLYAPQ